MQTSSARINVVRKAVMVEKYKSDTVKSHSLFAASGFFECKDWTYVLLRVTKRHVTIATAIGTSPMAMFSHRVTALLIN
jgi:hypothetical protein